tara:strand:+ start:185 stop:928 length:744 start_codon:yes stop_codon:yes gene_type:complete
MKSWTIEGQMTEEELDNHAHLVDTSRFPDFIREVMDCLECRYTYCYGNAFLVGVELEKRGYHCVYKEALVVRGYRPMSHAWLEVDGVDYDITGLGEIDGSFRYAVPSRIVAPNVPFNEPKTYETYMGAVPIRVMVERMVEALEDTRWDKICGMGVFMSQGNKMLGLPDYISMPERSLFPEYVSKVSDYLLHNVTSMLPYGGDFSVPGGMRLGQLWVPDLQPVDVSLEHAVCADNDDSVIGAGVKVAA